MRKPSPLLALLLALQLLLPIGLAPATALAKEQTPRIPPAPFMDVYATKYQDAVGALYALGVAQGTDEHSFSPDAAVTRAQMVAFTLRALGEHPTGASHTFKDVSASHWAAQVISRGVDLNLAKGDGNQFRPEDPVTYGEAATMLVRAMGYEDSLEPGDWPVNYLLTASKLGLMNEVDGSAFKAATRGDIALMIRNAIFKVKRKADGQTLSQSVFRYAVLGKVLPDNPLITGNTVQLSFLGIDWYGNSFPLSPNWKLYTDNASVDANGLLTVTGTGPVTVQGVSGAVMAAQTYTRVKGLTVTPSAVAAKVGSTVTVKVAAAADDGSEAPVTPTLTVSGPATLDTQSGTVTVTGTGAITVTATAAGLTGSAVINGVTDVSIAVGQQLVVIGDQVQLTLNGITGGSNVALPATWNVVSGNATVDSKGLFVGNAGGDVVVQGTYNGLSATTTIKVAAGLQITAASTNLSVGDGMQFTASINGTPVQGTWQWPANVGIGNQSGLFAATSPGAGTVLVKYGKLTATANITVAGPATSIQITASRNSVPANGLSTVTLTAVVVDALGNPAKSPTGTIMFNLSNTNVGTLTAFSVPYTNGKAQTTFTAGTTTGSVDISGSATGATLVSTTTTIALAAPAANGITLTATPDAINADGVSRSTLTATLVDQDGQPFKNNGATSIPVNLSSSNPAIGTFTNNGAIYIGSGYSSASQYFTAGTTLGTTFITANSSFTIPPLKLSTVTVGAPTKLAFIGDITPVVANGTSQMQVKVQIQDANGYAISNDNTSVITLSVSTNNNTISVPGQTVVNGTATFNFSAFASGTYTIAARSSAGVPAVQTTGTFLAGPPVAIDLVLDPAVDAVSADGRTPIRLVSHIVDVRGNVVTGYSDTITFSQPVKAGAFANIQPTAVQTVNGVATFAITPGLLAKTDYFQATSNNYGASAQVPVSTRITGAPVKLQVQPVAGPIPAGQPFKVSVYALDALSHVVTSENGRTVSLNLSDPNSTYNGAQVLVNGVATFTVTPSLATNLNLVATSAGLNADTTGQTVQITQAPADHIVLSAAINSIAADGVSLLSIVPKPVDAFGNAVTGYYPITLTQSTTQAGSLDMTAVGTYSNVNFRASSTPGTVTISGTSTLPVVPLTVTSYKVGAPTKVVVDKPKAVVAGLGLASQMQITVRVTDDNGNTVTSLSSASGAQTTSIAVLTASGMSSTSGATTTMSVTSNYPLPAGYGYPDGVVRGGAPLQNGVATFTFTDTKAENITFTPTLALGSTFLTPATATGTIMAGTPTTLTLTASANAVPVSVAMPVTVTAQLTDAYGNAADDTGDTITFNLGGTSFFTADTTTATVNGMSATINLKSVPGTVGNASITATSSKTGLGSAQPLVVAVDYPPQAPQAFVSSAYGNSLINVGDQAVQVYLAVNPRQSMQNVSAFVNGVQVQLYADKNLSSPISQIQPGSVAFVAYFKGSVIGGAGNKTFWVNVFNSLGSIPSQAVQFTTH